MASAVAETWNALVKIWVLPVFIVVAVSVAIEGSAPSTALLSAGLAHFVRHSSLRYDRLSTAYALT